MKNRRFTIEQNNYTYLKKSCMFYSFQTFKINCKTWNLKFFYKVLPNNFIIFICKKKKTHMNIGIHCLYLCFVICKFLIFEKTINIILQMKYFYFILVLYRYRYRRYSISVYVSRGKVVCIVLSRDTVIFKGSIQNV